MSKIYVASSWRNAAQSGVVMALREDGHEVYDFKNPAPDNRGFHWSEIDPRWQDWSQTEYRDALLHPVAERGFKFDYDAMQWADTCILVLPCGRSAHAEAGWMAGKGKTVLVLTLERETPELMYKLFDGICINIEEMLATLHPPVNPQNVNDPDLPQPPKWQRKNL